MSHWSCQTGQTCPSSHPPKTKKTDESDIRLLAGSKKAFTSAVLVVAWIVILLDISHRWFANYHVRTPAVVQAHVCSTAYWRARISAWACFRTARCLRVSWGMPIALELGPMANPLLASHDSRMHPTTSRMPACTTQLWMSSLPCSTNLSV